MLDTIVMLFALPRKMEWSIDLAMMGSRLVRQVGPMLNILTSQNLSNVLVVVTRYFGGILLGTGGLVKAYTEVTMKALKQAKIVEKEYGQEIQVVVNYADLEKMKYFLKQKKINMSSIQYGENVTVTVEITQENWNEVLEQRESLNFKILEFKRMREKFIVV